MKSTARVAQQFGALRPRVEPHSDERALCYDFYAALASRNLDLLPEQHLTEKDLEIELKFQHARHVLSQTKLGHIPLKQSGTDHPDVPAQPQIRLPHVRQQVEGRHALPPEGVHPITAIELKALAEEWPSPSHKNCETPFPLQLPSASGRYDRRKLGRIVS